MSLASINAANAGIDPYVGVKFGYALTSETDRYTAVGYSDEKVKIKQDDTFGGSVEIGAKLSDAWRLGIERNQYLEFKDELDGKWNASSIMVNLYGESQIKESDFYGMLMVGLGSGSVSGQWGTNKQEASGLVMAFGLGVAYKATENVMFDLMYRHVNNPTISGVDQPMSQLNHTTVRYNYETNRNEILLGARYIF